MQLDWSKWLDIIGGLSLFILNLVINNRLMKLQLNFKDEMITLKESIQKDTVSLEVFKQTQSDNTRRMDSIDRHLENTDSMVNSFFRNSNNK